MASESEISSTERLLKVIRGESAIEPETRESPPATNVSKLSLLSRVKKMGQAQLKSIRPKPGGRFIVGVDLGYTDVKLVKVSETTNGELRLLDFKTVNFPDEAREGPAFIQFLSDILTPFAGTAGNCQIWTSISSAKAEVTHFQIPRVPDKQVANAAYWTFKKDMDFDEEKMIFDFEVQDPVEVEGVEKLPILAFYAPRDQVTLLQQQFKSAGFELEGISIAPFSIQTLFRSQWLGERPDDVECNLYIGRSWSRIDLYRNGTLILIRSIKTGMHSMADDIIEEVEALRKRPPNNETADDPQDAAESLDFDLELTGAEGKVSDIFSDNVEIVEDSELGDELDFSELEDMLLETDFDNSADEISLSLPPISESEDITELASATVEPIIEPVIEPIIEPVIEPSPGQPAAPVPAMDEEPMADLDINMDYALAVLGSLATDTRPARGEPGYDLQTSDILEMISPSLERLVRQIERTFQHYVSLDSTNQVSRIFISGDLGTSRDIVRYLGEQLAIEATVIDPLDKNNPGLGNLQPPGELARRMSYTPAMGLALAANSRTPNFLFTYRDREAELGRKVLETIATVCLVTIVVICSGALYWQITILNEKQAEQDVLLEKLVSYDEVVDQSILSRLASDIIRSRDAIREYTQSHTSVIVLKELARIAGRTITLIEVEVTANHADGGKQVQLMGIVDTDSFARETELSDFAFRIAESRLFEFPAIGNRTLVPYEGHDVLYFTLTTTVPAP